MEPTRAPEGIGGWLLVLCALLIVAQPLAFAFVAAGVLSSVLLRGPVAIVILLVRIAANALGAGAGAALLFRRQAAVAMTKVSLTATAVTELFVILTPYFPGNRVPGDEPTYVAWTLAYYAVWMTYLLRSKRVRNTFHGA